MALQLRTDRGPFSSPPNLWAKATPIRSGRRIIALHFDQSKLIEQPNSDQVSDAILDACLKEDPLSKVACETATKTGMIMVFGEITTGARLNYQKVIRDAVKEIGYDHSEKGFDYKTCNVLVAIEEQSKDIAQGLHYDEALEKLGAGDQGIMFGYATDETPEMLPLTIQLAHKLNAAMTNKRKDGSLPWLRPDTKTQVTVEYKHDGGAVVPLRVDTVVVSAQTDNNITLEDLKKQLKEKIVNEVIPAKYLDDKTVYHVSCLFDESNFCAISIISTLDCAVMMAFAGNLVLIFPHGSHQVCLALEATLRKAIVIPSTDSIHSSNPPANSSSAALKAMPVSPVARSSSTHTAGGALTAAVPSLAKTTPKSTDQQPTSHGGSPSPLSPPSSPVAPLSNSPTPSVWLSLCQSLLRHMEPAIRPVSSWWRSSTRTSI